MWRAVETFLSTGSRSLQIQATLGLWLRCGCLSLTFGAASVSNILSCSHTSFWFGKYGQHTLGKTGCVCCVQRKDRRLGAGPAPGLAVPWDGEHFLCPCCPHSCPHGCCDTEVDRPLHREGWRGLERSHNVSLLGLDASSTPCLSGQVTALPGLSLSLSERRGRCRPARSLPPPSSPCPQVRKKNRAPFPRANC